MAGTQDKRRPKNGTPAPEIPDKLYFRIGEVARLLDLPPYVLRFWESEFPQLKPNKGGTGQRLYRRRDVETVSEIRRLLYDEGYTIPGARQMLKARPAASEAKPMLVAAPVEVPERGVAQPSQRARLRRLQADLHEIAGMLSRPAAPAVNAAGVRSRLVTARKRTPADVPPPLFAVPPRDGSVE